ETAEVERHVFLPSVFLKSRPSTESALPLKSHTSARPFGSPLRESYANSPGSGSGDISSSTRACDNAHHADRGDAPSTRHSRSINHVWHGLEGGAHASADLGGDRLRLPRHRYGEPAQTLLRSRGWRRDWGRRRFRQCRARAALRSDEIYLSAGPGS